MTNWQIGDGPGSTEARVLSTHSKLAGLYASKYTLGRPGERITSGPGFCPLNKQISWKGMHLPLSLFAAWILGMFYIKRTRRVAIQQSQERNILRSSKRHQYHKYRLLQTTKFKFVGFQSE